MRPGTYAIPPALPPGGKGGLGLWRAPFASDSLGLTSDCNPHHTEIANCICGA
jgi:hypothetical protein